LDDQPQNLGSQSGLVFLAEHLCTISFPHSSFTNLLQLVTTLNKEIEARLAQT